MWYLVYYLMNDRQMIQQFNIVIKILVNNIIFMPLMKDKK